jgi:hypothetical protein
MMLMHSWWLESPLCPKGTLRMATDIIVKHRVTDFDSFKPGFEQLVRAFAGETGAAGHNVHCDVEDRNNVVVTVRGVADAARARALFASSDFQQKMGAIGVCSAPDITFLDRVDEQIY